MKKTAAGRCCAAVNAEGSYGDWSYAIAKKPTDVVSLLAGVARG